MTLFYGIIFSLILILLPFSIVALFMYFFRKNKNLLWFGLTPLILFFSLLIIWGVFGFINNSKDKISQNKNISNGVSDTQSSENLEDSSIQSDKTIPKQNDQSSDNISQKDLENVVIGLKSQTPLPYKFGNSLTLNNITVEKNAIKQYYLITNMQDDSDVRYRVQKLFKDFSCQYNTLLDNNISMKASFIFEGTNNSFDLEVSKNDCN